MKIWCMRRQLVPGLVVPLTFIKAKTRPGIEARDTPTTSALYIHKHNRSLSSAPEVMWYTSSFIAYVVEGSSCVIDNELCRKFASMIACHALISGTKNFFQIHELKSKKTLLESKPIDSTSWAAYTHRHTQTHFRIPYLHAHAHTEGFSTFSYCAPPEKSYCTRSLFCHVQLTSDL